MEGENTFERPRLTSLSHGSGCGCKIAPLELEQILSNVRSEDHPLLLVGNQKGDDAAAYDLGDDKILIATTDFFMPIVDDPFDFGRIASVNAINDVFAMGGKPIMALAILGWPVEQLGTDSANEVMKGAARICKEHNIALAGGHSIESKEPFFGLAVNGLVAKDQLQQNHSAKPGDLLYLTKPIGTGMLATALKRGIITDEEAQQLNSILSQSNQIGSELAGLSEVHALTDVTGFGLLGHLTEMCSNKTLGVELTFKDIPLIDASALEKYSKQFVVPNNTMRNFKAYHEQCSKMDAFQLHVMCDPQTSGGLLVAVDPKAKSELENLMERNGINAQLIGHFTERAGDSPAVSLS